MAHTVAAELVGSVAKVLVRVGDTLSASDPVVILESMKMEIPVLAEVAGVVTVVGVEEGEVVAEGDTLAVIEPS